MKKKTKPTVKKHAKAGQPTKFCKELEIIMSKLYTLGLTDIQVADIIGVTEQTINNWKKAHPKFFESVKVDWKAVADGKVETSLYNRALGFDYEEVTKEPRLITDEETGIKTKTIVVTKIITKKIVADVAACIFWLKNRKPNDWKDSKELSIPDADQYFKQIADAISKSDGCAEGLLQG